MNIKSYHIVVPIISIILFFPASLNVSGAPLYFGIFTILIGIKLTSGKLSHSAISAIISAKDGFLIEVALCTLIALFAFLSTFASDDPIRAFRVLLPMILPLIIIFLISNIFRNSEKAQLINLIGFSLVVSVCLTGGLYVVGLAIPSVKSATYALGYRFVAGFDTANQASMVIIPICLALCGLYSCQKRFVPKLAVLLMIAVECISLLATGSKTAILFLVIFLIILFLLYIKTFAGLRSTILALMAISFALPVAHSFLVPIISLVNSEAAAKIEQILSGGVNDYQSIEIRYEIWNESIRLGLENPFFGVGAGTSILGWAHSHSIVLDYLRGMGVIAFLLVSALIFIINFRCIMSIIRLINDDDSGLNFLISCLYMASASYVACSFMSDSFGADTIFSMWIPYFTARFLEIKYAIHKPGNSYENFTRYHTINSWRS